MMPIRNKNENISEVRSRELRTLNKLLLAHHQVIIYGGVGVGKSALTRYYSEGTLQNGKYRFIFRIEASNGQSIEMGFVTLAREMGIPEDPERPQEMATIA